MKSSFCIDLQRFMLIPTKFPLSPDNGVAPGTAFEDIPDDWVCPLCGVGKDEFSPVD